MNTYNNHASETPGWIKTTVYGIILSIVVVAALAFFASGIIYFSSAGEGTFRPVGAGISIVALFAGGFLAAMKGKERGLLRGLAVGALFCLLLFAVALAGGSLTLAGMIKFVYYLIAGAIGGVCGVR